MWIRVALALAIGGVGGIYDYRFLEAQPHLVAYDFTWAWRGGRALLAGQNPYVVIQPTGHFPYNSAFKYPLPVAVVGVPLAHLTAPVAAAVFVAVSLALFTFALTRDGYWRLPILATPCVLTSIIYAQWSFLLTTAALVPALGWLSCLKPTTGLASFAYRPRCAAVIGGAVIYLLCLLLVPTWPLDWVRSMLHDPATHWYVPAIRIAGGPLLLLAALRWRTPEGRLLFVLALVPQVQVFYSAMVALLVARSVRESLVLAVLSCLGYVGWSYFDWFTLGMPIQDPAPHQAPWVLASVYLPALALVLRRPNAGNAPAWLDRTTRRFPAWLRGVAT